MNTRLRKPEPITVKGTCILCSVRDQASMGGGRYRAVFQKCHLERTGHGYKYSARTRKLGIDYRVFKKDTCEVCGFVAIDLCQLDVDHVDGDPMNNKKENLRTLCANCHRLKTKLNKDWESKGAG